MNLSIFDADPYTKQPIDPTKAGDGWEYDRADSFYSGKSINDVTLDAFQNEFRGDWPSSHHLLTDEAFLHFLPALIKIATDARGVPGEELGHRATLGGSLTASLARMARGELIDRRNAMLRDYSPLQLAVVAWFFEEEVHWEGSEDFEGTREALIFWRRFSLPYGNDHPP